MSPMTRDLHENSNHTMGYDKGFEIPKVNYFLKSPHPIELYPGAYAPFIDLSGDDKVPGLQWGHVKRGRAQCTHGHQAITGEVQSAPLLETDLTALGSYGGIASKFDELLPDTQHGSLSSTTTSILLHEAGVRAPGNYRSVTSQLDEFLPDTQRGSISSATTSLLSLDAPLNQEFLANIQICYPTPAPSPRQDSSLAHGSESAIFSEKPPQKLSCRERKRMIVPMNRPANVTKSMKTWIHKTYWLLDPFREDDQCWFHPSPPPARVKANGTLRPRGKIQKCFNWQDHRGKHAIVLNFGIVSKLLLNKLTKQQKDGLINKQWHLSHLCGNWLCLNPAHTTVELGSVNITRNNCFSHRSGCAHNPPCLKDKKVALDTDGRIVDLTAAVEVGQSQASAGPFEWGDWRQGFDEEDEFMVVEDIEGFESTAASITGDDILV